MQRLFRYLKSHSVHLYLSVSSSVLNKIFDLMPPLLTGWVIDSVRGVPPQWIERLAGTQDPFRLAILLSILAVVIFALESVFQWGYQYGFMTLAQRVQHELRLKVYGHLQAREMAFFETHRLVDTLAVMNDDVNQLERFLNTGLNELVQLAVLLVVSGGILFAISWQLAIVGVLPIPVIIFGSLVYQRLLSPRYKAVREAVGEMNSRLENNISGMMVIQSFTAEQFEYARVEAASDQYQAKNLKAIRISAVYTPIIRMAVVLGFAGVLLVGSYWVLSGSGVLTVGELVLFAMMTERLLWPLTRLGTTMDDFERAKASVRRIFTLLDTPSQIQPAENPVQLASVTGAIELESVCFGYPPDIQVLNGISIRIPAGKTIGIAGKTGCGKSTLIKLLMRFYDVQSGRIRIDGVDIRQMNLVQLRQSIALVSQDVYLFHGTIFENIAYGKTGTSMQTVIAAARQAELDAFVQGLPNGYNTIVGERGIRLSGGQRQRLSIARAIVKNAPIMVFDEATSSVDTETEKAIQANLDQLTAGKTALIVAHRLSTIRHADQI
ncbi:ABC transporter ATP-binding protein, partial [bacterium]|nr:ABC transporter ATP-binding protein [bacterium]